MEVGHLLREAREKMNLTQTELASRAGTAQSAVSRIEKNQVSPSVRTLEHLVNCAGAQLQITVVVPRSASGETYGRRGRRRRRDA